MFYDRKIKYVDAYENGEKIHNAGFVKLEKEKEFVSVQIKINSLKQSDTCTCPIILVGDEKEVRLGELALEQGNGTYRNDKLNLEAIEEGLAYDSLREVKIKMARGVELRCVINDKKEMEKERTVFKSEAELLKEAFVEERRSLANDALTPEVLMQEESVQEEQEQEEQEQEEQEQEEQQEVKAEREIVRKPAGNKWQQLWDLYPHIKPFEDGREYLVMKPEDFVILREEYYNLATNSFLLHGYYNYDHLVMVRETKTQPEKYYIGVPGNFYEKEKQVAVLFGFESFESKFEPAGTGDFGYYMVGVKI